MILVKLGLVLAVIYLATLAFWPYTPCGWCGGGGRNAGSNSRWFGNCWFCDGSGRKLRLGRRVLGWIFRRRPA